MGRGWNPQKPRTHMTTLIYVEHHQPYELIIIFELFFFSFNLSGSQEVPLTWGDLEEVCSR